MSSLFSDPAAERALTPLAERMRPRSLDEVAGQATAVEVLRELTSRTALPSIILWGPPGCGKTTIARLLAGERYFFAPMSAVTAGIKDVREAVEQAKKRRSFENRGTLLFLDEIHRFNKAQQDALLPHVEDGTIVLVGATTENPSFEVISPLLSRSRVLVLESLSVDDTEALLLRALFDAERGLGMPDADGATLTAEPGVMRMIAQLAAGDARFALNTLEVCAGLAEAAKRPESRVLSPVEDELSTSGLADGGSTSPTVLESVSKIPVQSIEESGVAPDSLEQEGNPGLRTQDAGQLNGGKTAVAFTSNLKLITVAVLKRALAGRALHYDKGGDEHFNVISALHKAVRGSDPDAALYYMTRMLEGGEDPKYLARRMIRMASEDIGLADPWAIIQAVAVKDAVEFLGIPECNTALAQLAVYLACAPKSNAVYKAYGATQKLIKETGALPPPLHIRNAPTGLMKDLGYGADYKYAHDFEGGFVADNYWPEALAEKPPRLLQLTGRGAEKTLLERLRHWWGERFEEKA